MIRQISFLLGSLLFTTNISAQDISIKNGWQLKGSDRNFTMSNFNKTCIDVVWKYDDAQKKWEAYSPDFNTQKLIQDSSAISNLTDINPTDGFWVKGNTDIGCDVNNSAVAVVTTPTTDGTISHNGKSYGTVTSSYTGKVWLDRNLGASQVCTALDDTACYGDYYQWGRSVVPNLLTNEYNYHVWIDDSELEFVITTGDWSPFSIYPQKDLNGSVRQLSWSSTLGKGLCPVDYRVPTSTEIENEIIGSNISNSNDAFSSFLRLPSSGYRENYNGQVTKRGTIGRYWTSSTYSSAYYEYSKALIIKIHNYSLPLVEIANFHRTYGASIRCIKAQ